jgi:hypothetical protein
MAVHKPGLSYFAKNAWNAGISTPDEKKEEALKWIYGAQRRLMRFQ